MDDLTPRQVDILRAIIQEYTESGEPVGSEILEKKYKLGVSPATVRNEMVLLAKKAYLKKTHFSSGRVPSAKGFRFYIKHLMKAKDLSTTDEVSFKNSIWDERTESHKLLQQATKVLAQKTGLLSLSTTNLGDIYYSGFANLLGKPEFYDPMFESCGCIFGEFEGNKIKGIIGVVGPKRMYYDELSPQIKYISHLLGEIIIEQGL